MNEIARAYSFPPLKLHFGVSVENELPKEIKVGELAIGTGMSRGVKYLKMILRLRQRHSNKKPKCSSCKNLNQSTSQIWDC